MRKKFLVAVIVLSILFSIGIALAYCLTCPQCGGVGSLIGKQKISDFESVCTYKCYQGHVWQCTCF